jgi:hypothetical protein
MKIIATLFLLLSGILSKAGGRGSSIGSGRSGVSSGRTSSSGSSSKPTYNPRTSTTTSTRRTLGDSDFRYGSSRIRGFPGGGGFFGSFGLQKYFFYYYFFAATSGTSYSKFRRTRMNSSCVAFSNSENEVARLTVSTNTAPFSSPGLHVKASPYQFEEKGNFFGNATFSTKRLVITFEGFSGEFGDRFNRALSLNNTETGSELDVQTSFLLNDMWSVNPYLTISSILMEEATASLRGTLFFFSDLLLLTGDFNVPLSNFGINGIITTLNQTTENLFKLVGVQSIFASNNSNGKSSVTVIASSSQMAFTNWNVTAEEQFMVTSGDFSFKGGSIEINSCNAGVTSIGIILAVIFGVIFLLCIVLLCIRSMRKRRNQKLMNVLNFDNGVSASPNGNIMTNYNVNDSNLQPPPLHNRKDATRESLLRSNQYFQIFPIGSPIAFEMANRTAVIPSSMQSAPVILTLMEPRQIPEFPWIGYIPIVNIESMDYVSGIQTVVFQTNQDVSIQTNQPLLPHQNPDVASFYSGPSMPDNVFYTIFIKSMDQSATIAAGFASCPYPPFRLPGWDPYSIAYHSDDGAVFMNDTNYGHHLGKTLCAGDTLGIGYYVNTELDGKITCIFYFTVNGVRLAQDFSDGTFIPSQIYPTIGCDGNCELEVKFGNVERVFFPVN